MRKISYFLVFLLIAAEASATYIVVLKNGTRYRAKDRWTLTGGKAIVQLENGSTIQLDPNLIDVAKSEEATRSGYGDARVLTTPGATQPTNQQPEISLADRARQRRQQQQQTLPPPDPGPTAPNRQTTTQPVTPTSQRRPGVLGGDVLSKFTAAYENMGFYDSKVVSTVPYIIRVELNADNEDHVFKAISATAYVLTRVPGLTGARVDTVELYMATLNGGAAGRFQMTPEDAAAVDAKKMSIENYFVRKAIF